MKKRSFLFILLMLALVSSISLADDGLMFRRNVSRTPDGETEDAALSMMPFYVTAQAADGTILTEGIDYYDAEGNLVDTRYYAKPLTISYIDDIGEHEVAAPLAPLAPMSGISFGARDTFVAHSLDDGATWKQTNVSRAADLSSFTLQNGTVYPGDSVAAVHAIAGDRIMVAWVSRYCDGGSPTYTLTDDEKEVITNTVDLPAYYLDDLFDIAGSQKSVDYTLQGFPEVGEIPYACVWTARGSLALDEETGTYDILWRKAERLTSGKRDANRVEIAADDGAGFVITWQEDPEGLRPGQGLGPGEGWSGAIVNSKTDIWYSYVDWDHFDLVCEDPDADICNPVPAEEYLGETTPKIGIPMAMPIRLTDNNMCKYDPVYDDEGNVINPYCYMDFNGNGTADLCAAEVTWTNPGNTTLSLCQTEDGRVLWGRTGASRARLTLTAYTNADDEVSAWVALAYEENKALGEGGDSDLDPIDIGKNVWYHSFDMFHPDLVRQGAMLNQPAVDPETGEFFEILEDDWQNEFYETEIARRFNIMTQPASYAGTSGTVGILIYKQGIINQGGPADIFLRRLVLPDDFDPAEDNPYAFTNMICEEWAYADGSNPNYLSGLCLDAGINVSGNDIIACDDGSSGEDCADQFPWDGGETYPKVVEWLQTPDNLDDQPWENPYDVAKGHRGFLDGDFVMMMYAWSPNWKANTVGNDHYNLYVRRSFDGGETWTTTPTEWGGAGTTTCEYYGHGSDVTEVCTDYGPGEFEQARNVSELVGNRITVLDPRYTPVPDPIVPTIYTEAYEFPAYDDDARDPSRFFIVYETGDNTTVAEGEATPLDLFYSRAYAYGDEYDYVEYYKDKDGDGQAELVLEWDWLENQTEDLSGEASVRTNPGATFFYATWNQWREDEHEVISDSDAWYRRVLYLDDEDAPPSVSILYASHTSVGYNTATEVTYIGSARDNDHVGGGIVAYRWESDVAGLLCTEQVCAVSVTTLSPGWHTISFTAQDAEGNWAITTTRSLFVAETLWQQYLPTTVRN